MRRVELPLLGLVLLAACEQGAAPALPSTGPVTVRIEQGVVRELAQRLSIPPEQARELAEEDALLAAELVRREPALSLSLERLALARELSQALLAEAARGGPPSDREIAELTEERWWELDRPRMVQVVHAVVLSETENMAAASLAESIASATARATTEKEFQEIAKAVPVLDQQVRVESVPPVTADGRTVDPAKPPPFGPSGQLAAEFAAAAQKLERVGQMSPVVRSSFGYHVLFAQRILEPLQPSLAERRERLGPEVMQRRALAAQRLLLAEQRQQSSPQQERSAIRSMAQLLVAQ